MMKTDVYVAAGSNIEPLKNLRRAIDALATHYGALKVSSAYRNKAVGFAGEDFVNMAVGFATEQRVEEVLARLHTIEESCGRPRAAPRWAPRSMDLDVLMYDALVCDRPGLALPRPDLLKRPYMLGPLAELAPALRHPTDGRTMAELWAAFDHTAHPLQKVQLPD
jgi:2-amino-4-hydroxy-6-hydroxymethyldihydropteridine diphosphokinase